MTVLLPLLQAAAYAKEKSDMDTNIAAMGKAVTWILLLLVITIQYFISMIITSIIKHAVIISIISIISTIAIIISTIIISITCMDKAVAALEKGATGFLQTSAANVIRKLTVEMDISYYTILYYNILHYII